MSRRKRAVPSDRGPNITVRGDRAVASGLPLFVLTLDGRWVPADRERARRMSQHANWIYGVEA